MSDILCHREQRYVGAHLSFHYESRQIILGRNETSEELAGKYVDLYDNTYDTLEIEWKGISLPYRGFAKDKRVAQTAVVENKRLGHALSLVKAQRNRKREIRDKGADEQRGRQVYGPDYIPNSPATPFDATNA